MIWILILVGIIVCWKAATHGMAWKSTWGNHTFDEAYGQGNLYRDYEGYGDDPDPEEDCGHQVNIVIINQESSDD